jgi:hypothetical protein
VVEIEVTERHIHLDRQHVFPQDCRLVICRDMEMVGLYFPESNSTSIYSLTHDSKQGRFSLNFYFSLPRQVNLIAKHGTRLICDNQVMCGQEVI